MRLLERNPRLTGLMLGLAVVILTGVGAQAQLEISSTEPGSIAIYPKVIADGTRDTIISLTNTTNMLAYAHCEATNGIGRCAGSPDPANQTYYCNDDTDCEDVTNPLGAVLPNVGPCEIEWQPEDFDVVLTAQQPTFWRVSTGRVQDPNLASGITCNPAGNSQICPGFFLAPAGSPAGGNIPGQSEFRGEVRCFQVDIDGELMAGDALKGEAFIERFPGGTPTAPPPGTGLLSGYNSINVEGGEPSANPTAANLNGIEYARCPATLTFDHLAPGRTDPATGAAVEVEFTLIPCTYSTVNPTSFAVAFSTYDELELENSAGEGRTCWANFRGSQIGGPGGRNTDFLRSRVRPSHTGNCQSGSPVGFSCSSNSDCGRGGICFANACVSGDATGFVCASSANCGGGVCGPPSKLLGVVETFYTGPGAPAPAPGTSAEVGYQLTDGVTNDVMTFTGGF